ncbi:unnamed protein product [Natator depressus]
MCVSGVHTHITAQCHGEGRCPIQMACSGLGAGAEAAAPAPRSLCRALHTSGATPAGDNIKGPRDAKHNPLFQKLVMLLHFAHKAGGPNPDFNTNLQTSLSNARAWS